MGKVVLYIATSLDGYIAREDGDVSWLDWYAREDEDYGYEAFFKSVGALVMGAGTYKQILSFNNWPYGKKRTIVATHRDLEKQPGANVHFYSGDLPQLVDTLCSQVTADIWLVGGSKLVASFMNEGLLEELLIFVMPILLSRGIPLFGGLPSDKKLTLISSKSFSTGVQRLHYRPAEPAR